MRGPQRTRCSGRKRDLKRSIPFSGAREIGLQALAMLAALAQISTPSAAHFLKSHQLLVQKFAADRDRQKKTASPFHSVPLAGWNVWYSEFGLRHSRLTVH